MGLPNKTRIVFILHYTFRQVDCGNRGKSKEILKYRPVGPDTPVVDAAPKTLRVQVKSDITI